nr:hypothetical protein B0A51_01245 [Rachicladosporium sp. CCFEE 5018]
MASLPKDALLLVISRLDIDCFLNARLLDRATHDLIIRHIRGLVASVARATFASDLGFLTRRPLPADSGASACLTWLKALRYHYLAAVMLECRRFNARRDSDLVIVSAEDPVGDDARFHCVAGLRVLNQFAVIAKAVEVLPQEQLRGDAGSVARTSGRAQSRVEDVHHEMELRICQRRLDYVRTLDLESLHAYRHLRHEEMVKLLFDYAFTPCIGTDHGNDPYKYNHFVTSWLFGKVARGGPAWLWQL